MKVSLMVVGTSLQAACAGSPACPSMGLPSCPCRVWVIAGSWLWELCSAQVRGWISRLFSCCPQSLLPFVGVLSRKFLFTAATGSFYIKLPWLELCALRETTL